MSRLKHLNNYFFFVPILLGLVAITGWLLNVSILYSFFSNGASMKFNTALGVLLMGIALVCLQTRRLKIAGTLGLIIFLFSVVTIAVYVFATNFYVDKWIVIDKLISNNSNFPGRMSALTATCFMLVSFGLELLIFKKYHWAQAVLVLNFLIVYSALIGLLLNISNLFQFGSYSAMAMPTALGLLTITLGCLDIGRYRGWLSEAFSRHSASIYLRYAIFYFFIFLPIFVAGFIWILKHTSATPEYLIVVMMLATAALTLPLAFLILKKLNRADDNLHALNQQLQKSATLLASKNHELTHVNQELDSLLHIISHDLKTPLMSLEGSLALMHRNLANKVEERDRALLTIPAKSVKRLRSTIDHLSEIIKSQKLDAEGSEDIDICELAAEIRAELIDVLEKTGGRIIIKAENCIVHYKRVHLRSVIQNLFTNALKFHHPDRPPIIQMQAIHTNSGVQIDVCDNGLGIPEKDISNLFNKYRRFHQHIEGSGVGLYLVQQLLSIKGGTIKVSSTEGVGTTFTLFLPA